MGKRLTPEERARREEEKAQKKKAREEARARKAAEKAEQKAAAPKKRRGMPSWLYWKIREQKAKAREHAQFMEAGKTALRLAQAIRKIQQKIMDFVRPILDHLATLKTPEARLIWSREPWSPQDRNRYNYGKRKEIEEEIFSSPDGTGEQDVDEARKQARRKTRARKIDHAKAIDKVLDKVIAELREDEHNAVTSSLENSYKKVYADILNELQEARRAIDADRDNASRMADVKDYTKGGKPRRVAPEKTLPANMPRLGNYGESVVFGAPSPDQVKTVLNAEFEGKDYSKRIWGNTEKLATELKDIMAAAVINGENSRVVAQKLAERMGVQFSHAQRLVRTEMNRILNQASLDAIKDAGGEEYEFLAIEDDRTCGRCLRLNRKRFKIEAKKVGVNCPPVHAHCRCTIISHFAWEDEGTDKTTPPAAPPKDLPGTQKSIEGWLKDVEAHDRAAAEAARQNPTPQNVQAAADAQDEGMKAREEQQREALSQQKRAIQQGKGPAQKKPPMERPKDIPTEANFEDKKKFGDKCGGHMEDLGLNVKVAEDREKYKEIINDGIRNANHIRKGFYTKQEPNAYCYRKKNMVILTRTTKEFITGYSLDKDPKRHTPLEERTWYKEMEIVFDDGTGNY